MDRLRRLAGRAFRRHSKCLHEESSSHHEAPKEEEVEEVEEATDDEERGEAEAPREIDEADAPYLSLEGDWEMQAYFLLKDPIFLHTPLYDS